MPAEIFRRASSRCSVALARLIPDQGIRFRIAVTLKLAAIPLLVLLVAELYTYSSIAVASLIPEPDYANGFLVFGGLLALSLLPACVLALAFCYPLAMIYRRLAPAVGALCCLPLVVTWGALGAFRPSTPVMGILFAYQLVALVVLLVVGTWLANERLSRRRGA
jgi:hypothetical protein